MCARLLIETGTVPFLFNVKQVRQTYYSYREPYNPANPTTAWNSRRGILLLLAGYTNDLVSSFYTGLISYLVATYPYT
jgi:hypothetical protein